MPAVRERAPESGLRGEFDIEAARERDARWAAQTEERRSKEETGEIEREEERMRVEEREEMARMERVRRERADREAREAMRMFLGFEEGRDVEMGDEGEEEAQFGRVCAREKDS